MKNAPNNAHSGEIVPDFVGPVVYRTCTCCGQTKSMFEFSRHTASKYRRSPVCRVCNTAKSRDYYKANTEACSAAMAEYRSRNAEGLKAKKAAYFQANKDAIVAKRRAERVADPQRYHAYWAAYYEKRKHDPEYIAKAAERRRKAGEKAAALKRNRERRYADPASAQRYQAEYRAANRQRLKDTQSAYYKRLKADDPGFRDYRRRHIGDGGFIQWRDYRALCREAAELTRATGVKHVVDHVYPLRSSRVSGLNTRANLQVVPETYNQSKGNRLLASLSDEHFAVDPWEVFDDRR